MSRPSRSRNTSLIIVLGLFMFCAWSVPSFAQIAPGGSLDPLTIPKYVDQLPIPQKMPETSCNLPGIDYYEIAVRQIQQQILPWGFPKTTLWTYGSKNHSSTFKYPANTIEAKFNRPVRVKWYNQLVNSQGKFLPHLFPIDQTLHWANPPKDCIDGTSRTDCRGDSQLPYMGPVPIVPHLHGAHVGPESDGYPEAWWLPAANNIPSGYGRKGGKYDQFDPSNTTPGTAVFQYPNDQRATTLWYHDHSLGMTRVQVYAGPAGFYLIRGGPDDLPSGKLPSGKYEVPIVIQDKTFSPDGKKFVYPDNRAYFEGLLADQLQIPFTPEPAVDGLSDVSPLWNPEFFADTMVVNGKTWPVFNVEPRRYRMRLLNACDSRFLILKLHKGMKPSDLPPDVPATPWRKFWQIGADGGFLPQPAALDQLLMGPAERADVIVDFTGLKNGEVVYLINEGPDEPFGGGVQGTDFPIANRATTGQVIKFVVGRSQGWDSSVPPAKLNLPGRTPLGNPDNVRQVSLNELESGMIRDMITNPQFGTVYVPVDADGNYVLDSNGKLVPCFPPSDTCVPFGPTSAMLGTVMFDNMGMPMGMPMMWEEATSENPVVGDTEVWEIYNFTMDAHPIHIHQVQFEVMNREVWDPMMPDAGMVTDPEPWETGTKDTVLVYPGQITRVKAKFDIPGLYVWHCHILSHEDNEMMRPFKVVQ